jgi:glucokinase
MAAMSHLGGAGGAIGLDIGGTKIAVGIAMGAPGRLEHRAVAWTRPELGIESVLKTADALIEDAIAAARAEGIKLSRLGIAVPELVDTFGQIFSEAVVVGLSAVDLRARYSEFDVVVVESDVRAAAVAEARVGAGKSYESFCYVSVGTGISHCLVQSGAPWRGSRGSAILLGSSVMAEWQDAGASRRWVLEEISSGPAVLARYRALGGAAGSVREVLDAYATEASATRSVDEAAAALGIGLATLVNLLDPECLVVGGGLGVAPGPYFELAVASARSHIYSATARDLAILQAECGEDSAVLGAAVLTLEARAASAEP